MYWNVIRLKIDMCLEWNLCILFRWHCEIKPLFSSAAIARDYLALSPISIFLDDDFHFEKHTIVQFFISLIYFVAYFLLHFDFHAILSLNLLDSFRSYRCSSYLFARMFSYCRIFRLCEPIFDRPLRGIFLLQYFCRSKVTQKVDFQTEHWIFIYFNFFKTKFNGSVTNKK